LFVSSVCASASKVQAFRTSAVYPVAIKLK
jgi:hypothetical protein